jgi:putative two-component system response regulator
MSERDGKRILVVDDDEQVRRLLGRLLERAGYEYRLEEGADAARLALEKQSFDLVLCDVHMPGGSGFSLMRDLLVERPDIPTVMVTGMNLPELSEIAAEYGASGFVPKPFDADQVLSVIKRALSGTRSPALAAGAETSR